MLTIAASSALAAYEAVTRLLHPRHVSDLIAVAAAALVGFAGNELAAGTGSASAGRSAQRH